MSAIEDFAQQFDANRRHLRSVAFYLLGSAADAETRPIARLALGPSAARIVAGQVQSAWLMRGTREVAEETRQFTHCAQAGVVLFIDGAPGIAIAPAGRLQALLRIFVGNDDRIHAIDIIGDAGRLRTAALALPNPAAAAPRNTTAASTTKDLTGLTRAPDIGGPAGTGRGQERHVR